jgi:hypothetical protein
MPWLLTSLGLLLLIASATSRAEILAESGFNDAAGIHASERVGSPFILDAPLRVEGAEAEPGWAGPWAGLSAHDSMKSIVQSRVVFEGDGAIVQGAEFNATARTWQRVAEVGFLGVQVAVRFVGNARARFSVGDGDHVSAQWVIDQGGNFVVFDGRVGDTAGLRPTEFRWQTGRWHVVTVIADSESRGWLFFVDGVPHDPQDGLEWRSIDAPAFAQSSWWFESEGGTQYVDAVRVFVPDALILEGRAEGGRVCLAFRMSARTVLPEVCSETQPGQSVNEVLLALGHAIESDPVHVEHAIHPVYGDGLMLVAPDIEWADVDDPGLTRIGEQTGVRGRGAVIAVLLLATGIAAAVWRSRSSGPRGGRPDSAVSP